MDTLEAIRMVNRLVRVEVLLQKNGGRRGAKTLQKEESMATNAILIGLTDRHPTTDEIAMALVI